MQQRRRSGETAAQPPSFAGKQAGRGRTARRRAHPGRLKVGDTAEATATLAAAGATIIASLTQTPWRSLNARLAGPAGLQLTLFSEVPSTTNA